MMEQALHPGLPWALLFISGGTLMAFPPPRASLPRGWALLKGRLTEAPGGHTCFHLCQAEAQGDPEPPGSLDQSASAPDHMGRAGLPQARLGQVEGHVGRAEPGALLFSLTTAELWSLSVVLPCEGAGWSWEACHTSGRLCLRLPELTKSTAV